MVAAEAAAAAAAPPAPTPAALSASPSTLPRPSPTASPYPYAAAPDIIRAQQKDAYFSGTLASQLTDLHRRVWGARSAHAWAAESRALADGLYLGLTTLLGSRTLGEEYCDLVQVEGGGGVLGGVLGGSGSPGRGRGRMPGAGRRAAYIVACVLVPYAVGRAMPGIRGKARAALSSRLAALARRERERERDGGTAGTGETGEPGETATADKTAPHTTTTTTTTTATTETRILRYLLAHLATITSGVHARALVLAAFYFTGAYYSLSKRLLGLRYVFTRRVPTGPGTERAGYEVLGVLLAAQLAVQAWFHVREVVREARRDGGSNNNMYLAAAGQGRRAEEEEEQDAQQQRWERAATMRSTELNLSLDETMYSSNNELLLDTTGPSHNSIYNNSSSSSSTATTQAKLSALSHTPLARTRRGARFDLRYNDDNDDDNDDNDDNDNDGVVMAWIKGRQQRRCTLCLEELRDPSATQCGHVFCWTCICDWVREKPECPLCRREALVQHVLPLRAA
jgi:peroxin-10